MPSLSEEFGVSIAAIGYLISAYAVGMIVGGPILTIALLKVPLKKRIDGFNTCISYWTDNRCHRS